MNIEDSNFFAELQMLNSMENDSVVDNRKLCNELLEYFKSRPEYKQEVIWFAELVRSLKPETLFEADGFMVQDDFAPNSIPEHLRHDSLGFCRDNWLIYSGRFVYPIKDVKGDVMGWCGYDKYDPTKYLDSRTYGYIAKQGSMWGMEKLPEYYRSSEPVYIVEGIGCALYLRQEGCQALASLGSYLTPYVIQIISRFKKAIVITDSDGSGNKYRAQVRKVLPKVRVVQSTIEKDIDDSRKVSDDFIVELKKLSNPFYVSKLFS